MKSVVHKVEVEIRKNARRYLNLLLTEEETQEARERGGVQLDARCLALSLGFLLFKKVSCLDKKL